MKNKTKIRLRRLFGEGTMIVISILFAFGIDAMWAQHQINKEEQIERVINSHLSSHKHVSNLVHLSSDDIKELPQAIISAMMLSTSNAWTFDPILGTTKSLVDSGRLGIIQNQYLRDALTSFLRIVLDLDEEVYYMKSGAIDLWRSESKHGGPWTYSDLLKIREDKEFMSLVSRYHINVAYYLSDLVQLKQKIVQILEVIED